MKDFFKYTLATVLGIVIVQVFAAKTERPFQRLWSECLETQSYGE